MINSFDSIIDKSCRVLILGSVPSVKSLEINQYYGNPRNQFWKIVYELFEEKYQEEYEERKKFLLKHNIALWDVIKGCDREGSLDTAIKNEEANNFEELINEYQNIDTIIFNGGKAHDTFKKLVGFEQFKNIKFYKLPSTSPAHTISFDKKIDKWSILKRIL